MSESYQLGKKIREKRLEQGLSLKQLADKIGKTPSFLSQIERGLADPSITSLRRISETLEVPLFYLLMGEKGNSPVVRKNQRRSFRFPGYKLTYELLTPYLNVQIEMLETTIKPGVATCETAMSHNGEECTIVIKGVMEIQLGEETYILEEGDSIYYFGVIPHKITNIGAEDLLIISAITPPEF